jgi:phosphomannomutase
MDPLSDVLSLLKPVSYVSAGFDAGGDWSIQFTDQHEHQMLRRDFRRVLAVRRGRSRHGASEDRNYRIVLRVICDTYRNLSPQRRNLFGEKILGAGHAGVKRGTCFDPDRTHSLVITPVAINQTPKVLSTKHEPEWLDVKSEAILHDLKENADLALAHDWDCCWDVGEE